MNKKIFPILVLAVFILALAPVSAELTFDNKITYTEDDLKVTIDNLFGLGSELGTLELKSHTSVDEVLQFGFGQEEVVMYYDFTGWELYKNGLGEVTFIDERTNEEIEKDYYFVEWVSKLVEVNDYQEICNLLKNGTNDCSQILSGTHLETKWSWKRLETNDIPNRNTRIGLKTYVGKDDYIDGIWTIAGKEITRHASWSAGLNVGLRNYLSFDDLDGNTVIDGLGNYNGTKIGSNGDLNVAGKIGNGFNVTAEDSGGNYINITSDFYRLSDDGSISFWINLPSQTPTGGWLYGEWSGNILLDFCGAGSGCDPENAGRMRAVSTGAGVQMISTTYMNESTWNHVVFTRNVGDNNASLYINGIIESTTTQDNTPAFTTKFLRIMGATTTDTLGNIDEWGMWNRTLSQAEVTQLYNDGSGITYTNIFTPKVTLNSPTNTTNTTNPIINFNGTITILTPVNVTLLIDGTYNETNTSGILGDYLFTKILSEGDHTWNMESCTSELCGNGTERHLFIDSILPTISIESPISIYNYLYQNYNITLNTTITDTNLDTCWYDYNNTNTTFSCSTGVKTFTGFNYEPNYNNITIWANDTIGNQHSNFTSWDVILIEEFQIYNSITTETAIETFNISLFYNNSLWDSISTELNYDGINYTGFIYHFDNNPKFYSNVEIPSITNSTENKTFFWYIDLSNATGTFSYASQSNVQNISEISISICSVGETPYLRFITRNAENPFPILNATFKSAWDLQQEGGGTLTNFSYEDITEVNNTWEFCLTPNTTNYTISADIEIDAIGYAKNFYYLTDADYVAGETINTSLYLLNDSLATPTTLLVKDKFQNPIEEILIYIQLYDVGTDIFYTVGMSKTNNNGEDSVYLNWYDSLYKFILIQDGTTVLNTNESKIFETPKTFELLDTTTYSFDKFQDFDYSLTFGESTKTFSLTYIKPSGEVEEGCLRVIKRTSTEDTQICLTCSSSVSATLSCDISTYENGTFIAAFYATGSWYLVDWIDEIIGENFAESINSLLDEDDAAFYTIMLIGIVLSMFLFNIILGIIGVLLGLLAAGALGFTVLTYSLYLGIVIIGGMIIWILKK